MKHLISILIILAFMSVPAFGDITFGGHLGVNIEKIKDPGASLFLGMQESADVIPLLGESDYIRFIYQSVNFGNEQLSNVSLIEIHYFGISERWDLGSRISGDYQPDDGNLGYAIGLEFIRKGFVNRLSAFACVDAVKKPELDAYFNFGRRFLELSLFL